MKVLVTGANGYLGRGIVDCLLCDNAEVVATDIRMSGFNRNVESVEADLFSIENPYDYFSKPDIVIHLAWRDGFKHFSGNHIGDLPGHVTFLERICRADIKRLGVMGSMHEVGFFEGSIN